MEEAEGLQVYGSAPTSGYARVGEDSTLINPVVSSFLIS